MHETSKSREGQLSAQEIYQAAAELLKHFGVETDPAQDAEQFLESIAQLDPRYSGGRELVRWQLEADQTEWPEDTKQIIMRTAESMRMLEHETPLRGDFDVVVVLGGARQANYDRTLYAAEAEVQRQASFRHLIVAGSIRRLNEAEQTNTQNYAPEATTEADLISGAAKVVSRQYPELVEKNILSVFVVEDEKAGTPKILEEVFAFMQNNSALEEGSRVGVVTTQIYQASTQLDLNRVAEKFGIAETFTAGNPSDPKLIEARTPATYLSEVIRTLRAATLVAQAER